MRILFGHHGLRGDLFLNLPAIDHLHKGRGLEIDMPINKAYADCAPLFYNHPSLNSVIITDAYDGYPSKKDRALWADRQYGKIFNPMAQPRDFNWFQHMHQAARVADDYEVGPLTREQCQIRLNQWFDVEPNRKWVAIAAYAGWYNPNNDKRLSEQRAQEIVNLILSKGYKVLQIGGPGEPKLEGAEFPQQPYFDSIKTILGCKLLIHTDSGCGWAISGYQFPQLGLYSNKYYSREFVKNIQPINPNGVYLDEENVNQISLDSIEKELQDMLA